MWIRRVNDTVKICVHATISVKWKSFLRKKFIMIIWERRFIKDFKKRRWLRQQFAHLHNKNLSRLQRGLEHFLVASAMSDVNLERAKASPTVNTRVNDIAGTTKKLFGYPLIMLLLFLNGEVVVMPSFRGSQLNTKKDIL